MSGGCDRDKNDSDGPSVWASEIALRCQLDAVTKERDELASRAPGGAVEGARGWARGREQCGGRK